MIIHIIVYTANIMNVYKSESDAVGYGIMKYPDSPQHQTKQVVKIQSPFGKGRKSGSIYCKYNYL
jgi:hypothetical protein